MDTQTTTPGRILVVDDDPGIHSLLGRILAEHGHSVLEATSAETALDLLAETTPDLALLDIRMPNTDGFELCRQLKRDERYAAIPILFLSGLIEKEDIIKGFSLGCVDYIVKPFSAEEVLARVETHLRLRQVERVLEKRALSVEQEYRQLAENTNDVVFALDAKGRFTFISTQIKRYGLDPDRACPAP